jgi:predicted ATPase/class 3 adenylate cyclase
VTSPPTGTVTFLFTDIEGSTQMWEQDAQAMQRALSRHDEILRDAIEERGGYVFKTVGDAFCAAFPTAPEALEAALSAQRALLGEEWQEAEPLRVRMALHTGATEERDGDYFGPPLNRVARLLSAAHARQVLLSLPTQELVRDQLPAATELRDLGEHRLKDLFRPERVFQLVAPDLPSEFPPLRTLGARPNNLPQQPTPLVGREREVEAVRERLLTPEVRLLTLTGPGGIGKTRLALQAAAEALEEFADGAFFVPLATIGDPVLVVSAVAASLGVVESGEQHLEDSLKAYLREKQLLLLLDNFEQVLKVAPQVGELLSACPALKVLATSRIPLRLYGEREFPVPPLALPDPGRLPPPERLTQYEAVRLFVERARDARPDFSVTNENAPAVAEICHRLDGLPLAIELAAARAKILPPQAMLARLSDRFKLLKGGARDLPARQQTLRGAIDWSHDLLEEDERVLFARQSVFAGGCSLEAAEAVCDAEGDLAVDVLDGMASLVDKSLLGQEEGRGGESRFSMLRTIREYALERLKENGEAEELGRLHAEHFLALVEEAEPELKGPLQLEWFVRLEEEHNNIRVALSWALENGEVELALRLGGALVWFWQVRGHISEGRRWLEEGLTGAASVTPPVRAKALAGLGLLVDIQGDYERAVPLYEEGLALYREMGDRAGIAHCLNNLGFVAQVRGAFDRAKAFLEESASLYRELGNEADLASALNMLGLMASFQGDHARAKEFWEESVALSRRAGDTHGVARSLSNIGFAVLLQGDYERATPLIEEALALNRELGSAQLIVGGLINRGLAAREMRDHDRSAASFEEALVLAQEMGDRLGIIEGLEGMAGLVGTLGEDRRAALLWGAAGALREDTGARLADVDYELHEPHLDAARSRLGEAAWEEALVEGRAMTLEQMVANALGEDTRA